MPDRDNYSIDDIVSQVRTELGFSYIRSSHLGLLGYFIIDDDIILNVEFNEDGSLEEAEIELSDSHIDLLNDSMQASKIQSSIESGLQIIGIINRMTKDNNDEIITESKINLNESLSDISSYLTSSDLKSKVLERFPDIRRNNSSVDDFDVCDYIVQIVSEVYPDEYQSPVIDVCTVYKVVGNDLYEVSTDHSVIRFNGQYYDYCAMKFTDNFDNLNYSRVPITQKVITNVNSLNEGVSSLKYYSIVG